MEKEVARLRLAWKKFKNTLFGFKGTAIHCPKCGGLNVGFGSSLICKDREAYNVECRDCGNKGRIVECWDERKF